MHSWISRVATNPIAGDRDLAYKPRRTLPSFQSAKAKKCEAMAGLIEEAQEMMEEEADAEVMDAVIIGLAQKVEHYEIATYGTLCSWAESLRYTNAKEQLGENLAEEENADKTLSKISTYVNKAAETVGK
jgi:ferritin-like metal-binding protein YciE